ncbi:DUF1972 domain-containing protein [Microlunatus kandeliicorticis]|uniref:DUF1972 domain-containing protein n=1 Tax=Microlunatus kandeliicorticis TaxID=1759536 RepID=UPI0015F814C1|nr:DUF1972 domain-containing protein [Microlunatus kandeliicorticis]
MIGTRGVPARYGGFETCVEEVGSRLAEAGHQVVVFCRSGNGHAEDPVGEQPARYRGMELVWLPAVHRRALETLSHTARSVLHPALSGSDVALVFNAANAPLLPVLRARRIPVATHVDGLEWKRAKWSGLGARYYRAAESLAVSWSNALIADAAGIVEYYNSEFGVETRLIAYGAPITDRSDLGRLDDLDLPAGKFHLLVARFEPENHVLEIVQGYVRSRAELPLVVVGSAPYSASYTQAVRAAADRRVRFLGGIWDQEQLDQLYAGALTYLHGHSVGGTNPSLLRAAGAAAYTIAYDVGFNREVLEQFGDYFRTPDDVAALVEAAEAQPSRVTDRGLLLQSAARRYDWDEVASAYALLCEDLAGRRARLRGWTRGVRRGAAAGATSGSNVVAGLAARGRSTTRGA